MWDDYPFSESNKITKRTVVVEVGSDQKEGRRVGQNLKRRVGGYAIYWGGLKK